MENASILVEGLRSNPQTNYTISYNDKLVEFRIHDGNAVTATTSWKTYGTIFGNITKPPVTIQFMEQYGAVILRVTAQGVLQYRSITGSSVNASSLVAYACWLRNEFN